MSSSNLGRKGFFGILSSQESNPNRDLHARYGRYQNTPSTKAGKSQEEETSTRRKMRRRVLSTQRRVLSTPLATNVQVICKYGNLSMGSRGDTSSATIL